MSKEVGHWDGASSPPSRGTYPRSFLLVDGSLRTTLQELLDDETLSKCQQLLSGSARAE
jgi:hypothetical protein